MTEVAWQYDHGYPFSREHSGRHLVCSQCQGVMDYISPLARCYSCWSHDRTLYGPAFRQISDFYLLQKELIRRYQLET